MSVLGFKAMKTSSRGIPLINLIGHPKSLKESTHNIHPHIFHTLSIYKNPKINK